MRWRGEILPVPDAGSYLLDCVVDLILVRDSLKLAAGQKAVKLAGIHLEFEYEFRISGKRAPPIMKIVNARRDGNSQIIVK